MLTHSEGINQIATALAKAQSVMDNASKDRTNPAFRSAYADLASVREATSGPLSANGIAVLQAAATTEHGVTVETRLVHTSGQWFACTLGAVPKAYDPQSIGSTITYLRRYGLMSMAGIAPEDDDGNAASGWREERRDERREPPHEAPPAGHHASFTETERAKFCAALKDIGLTYDNVAAYAQANGPRLRPSAMTTDQRRELYTHLRSADGRASFDSFMRAPAGGK